MDITLLPLAYIGVLWMAIEMVRLTEKLGA